MAKHKSVEDPGPTIVTGDLSGKKREKKRVKAITTLWMSLLSGFMELSLAGVSFRWEHRVDEASSEFLKRNLLLGTGWGRVWRFARPPDGVLQ